MAGDHSVNLCDTENVTSWDSDCLYQRSRNKLLKCWDINVEYKAKKPIAIL